MIRILFQLIALKRKFKKATSSPKTEIAQPKNATPFGIATGVASNNSTAFAHAGQAMASTRNAIESKILDELARKIKSGEIAENAKDSTLEPIDESVIKSNNKWNKKSVISARKSVEGIESNEVEVLLELRSKVFKLGSKKWDQCGSGILRIYRHKPSRKTQMVLRNQCGIVQLNLAINYGMKFVQVENNAAKGVTTFVRFGATDDATGGVAHFMLQVKPELLERLHSTLTKLAE
mmetsp:Transcript_17440/g.35520  ORF Transcript_17440/g.35520 Transcript_17440/m.35520 type:complete len:235 (-) Transcript_17440:1001-1705(-)